MMRTLLASLTVVQCWAFTAWASPGVLYKSIHFPGARHTFANSIYDGIIVGTYSNSPSTYPHHGFLYDGSSYTTIDYPGSVSTVVSDIDDNKIVGYYDLAGQRHGFIYEDGAFTTLDHPLTSPGFNGSEALGLSGDRIVGIYMDGASRTHGYVFDGETFMTIDHPFAGSSTTATGIDRQYIVGTYTSGGKHHGYLYDGVMFQTVDHPLGASATLALDVSGGTIVGYYVDSGHSAHGYMFDGVNYTTLAVPSAIGTQTLANGIHGNIVVGQYLTHGGEYRGFVTVPEPTGPAALLVLATCLMAIPMLVSRQVPAAILLPNCRPVGRANSRWLNS